MKKIMISLVAATSLVFGTGCGGDICDDTADAYDSMIEKTEDCDTTNAFLKAFQPNDSQVDSCKESLDECSDSDEEKANDAIDCFNDLPDCEADEEEEWQDKLEACIAKQQGISDECLGE